MFTSACNRAVQMSNRALRPFGQFHADQVALDDRQPGPFQNLAPLLGVAQQEPDEGAFGRVGDRQGHDPHPAPLETANHLQQLPYLVLQENRKLPDGRVVSPPHRGKVGAGGLVEGSCEGPPMGLVIRFAVVDAGEHHRPRTIVGLRSLVPPYSRYPDLIICQKAVFEKP